MPERTAPPRTSFYVPQLDLLRFVAFLLVFCHHTLPVTSRAATLLRDTCGFGLSLFFFLSSYLITLLLQKERSSSGTINIPSFYIRRLLRIWPLYFFYLALLALASTRLHSIRLEPARFMALALLVGNWYAIAHGMGANVVSPLWSISVEEQFYLVWPGLNKRLTPRHFVLFAVGVSVCSLLITGWLAWRGATSLTLWLNTGTEALMFASGALLALFIRPVRPSVRTALAFVLAGSLLWYLAEAFASLNDRSVLPTVFHAVLGYALVAGGCALLLIGALALPARATPAWGIYLGKISYGLYIFHALAIHFISPLARTRLHHLPGAPFALTLLVTIALAAMSYRFLEMPFLKLKRRFETVKTRTA